MKSVVERINNPDGIYYRVKDAHSGLFLGGYEYEKGYGVHARAANTGSRKTFLTHGYRAAVGLEVVGEHGKAGDIAKAKKLAKKWIESGERY